MNNLDIDNLKIEINQKKKRKNKIYFSDRSSYEDVSSDMELEKSLNSFSIERKSFNRDLMEEIEDSPDK